MDMVETLKNPWVIGGGVVIGVVLLTMGKGSATAVGSPGPSPDALYGYAVNVGAQQVDLAKTRLTVDAADAANRRAMIVNAMGASYNFQMGMQTLTNEITKGRIAAATALTLDRQGNAMRIAVTSMTTAASVDQTRINASAAMDVAHTQASAAERVAQTQANASIFNNVIGTVGKFAMGLFGL